MIDKLIELSKVFKDGFTVQLKDGKLTQYNNCKKPYIVSYKLIVGIGNVVTTYNRKVKLTNNCIIGGWHDKSIDEYFIELNRVFKDKNKAILFARKHNQKAVYNIATGDVIEV